MLKECISRRFLHEVLSNGLNGVNTNSLRYVDCGFITNFSVVYLAKIHYHLISSNTHKNNNSKKINSKKISL